MNIYFNNTVWDEFILSAMNRAILMDRQQLKCNVCTQWYSVGRHFADCQRYSFNCCESCFASPPLLNTENQRLYELFFLPRTRAVTLPLTSLHSALQSKPLLSEPYLRLADSYSDFQSTIVTTNDFVASHFHSKVQALLLQWKTLQNDIEQCYQPIKTLFQAAIHSLEKTTTPMDTLTESCSRAQGRIQQAQIQALELSHRIKEQLGTHMLRSNALQIPKNQLLSEYKNVSVTKSIIYHSPVHSLGLKKKFSNASMCASRAVEKQNLSDNGDLFGNKSVCVKKNKLKMLREKATKERSKVDNKERSKVDNKEMKVDSDQESVRVEQEIIQHKLSQKKIQQEKQNISQELSRRERRDTYFTQVQCKEEAVIRKCFSKKNMVEAIVETKARTILDENVLELACSSVRLLNFECYLKTLQLPPALKIVRMIKAQLVDADFDAVLKMLANTPTVQILVATNNLLTKHSVEALLNFKLREPHSRLTHVYLANNLIKPSLVRPLLTSLFANAIQLHL